MKLYKFSYMHPFHGSVIQWASSRQKAQNGLRDALADLEDPEYAEPTSIEKVEVPTDKEGLIEWLNENACTECDSVLLRPEDDS